MIYRSDLIKIDPPMDLTLQFQYKPPPQNGGDIINVEG